MSAFKTMNEFVRETLRDLMLAAAADVARAVLPIYCATKSGRPEHLGSCVLIKWKGRRLLVTAAHVIDANKVTSLHIPVRGQLQKLEGSGMATTAPGGMRDRDRYDFGLIEMSQQLTGDLGDIRYVQEHELALQIVPQGRGYMAFGYPNSQNKTIKTINHAMRTITPRRFSYGGPLVRNAVVSAKQSPLSLVHHLRMKYDKRSRTVEGDVVQSIDPKGISGGALFDLGRLLETPDSSSIGSRFRLAGILIERLRKEKVIIATKIETVLSVLSQADGPMPPR